jgi:hypothetical protein
MDVEFSDKKLDLKDRRRFQEIISKKKITRTFSKLRLRLKKYEKDGKRSKYVISAEAETSKGKIIHSEGIDWRFGIALKQTISKLLKQIKR